MNQNNANSKKKIKLLPNDTVAFVFNYDDLKVFQNVTVETEPVFNRQKFGWITYQLFIDDGFKIGEVINFLQSLNVDIESLMMNKVDRYIIEYSDFRKLCKNFKAREIKERFTEASDQDLIKDIENMHNETDRIRMLMDSLKYQNEIAKYHFYEDLLYNRVHDMFGFDDIDQYNEYIKKLNEVAIEFNKNSNRSEHIKYIQELSNKLWDDSDESADMIKN